MIFQFLEVMSILIMGIYLDQRYEIPEIREWYPLIKKQLNQYDRRNESKEDESDKTD